MRDAWMETSIDEHKRALETEGYTVLRTKSYLAAQERQRRAECWREAAEQHAESSAAWARDCLAEQRRLADRLTFVYGVARAHGATVDELRGDL